MDARHTLKCYIYKFNTLRNLYYRYTTFQWWCEFSISIINSNETATEPWILVQMHMVNERYQQTVTSDSPLTVGLPVTPERYWACFQATRLFQSATVFVATYVFVGWRYFGVSNVALVNGCDNLITPVLELIRFSERSHRCLIFWR